MRAPRAPLLLYSRRLFTGLFRKMHAAIDAVGERGSVSCAPFSTVLPPSLHTQLLRDMQHWAPQTISRSRLEEAPESDTRATLGIQNGTVFWLRASYRGGRSPLLHALVEDLIELSSQYEVPTLVINVNVFDEPVAPLQLHPAPVFSFFQTRAAADVLMPDAYFRMLGFDRLPGPQYYREHYPWSSKQDRALWRGSLFCGPNPFMKCARLLLAHLSDQNASDALDVRFTAYNAAHDVLVRGEERASDLPRPARPLSLAARVPIPEHAAARFLIDLDGFTASSRLQCLLSTNSVVLKMESYFWSYFGSAFVPHVHYIPFWISSPRDLLELLPRLSTEAAGRLEHMGQRASELAHRVLSRRARSIYWLVLLRLYANRLESSAAQPDQWPHATAAKRITQEGRSPNATNPVADPDGMCTSGATTRREDERAAADLVRELEAQLSMVRRSKAPPKSGVRPAVRHALPEHGDASLGLFFESNAERRAMAPELDHAYLQAAQQAHRWTQKHTEISGRAATGGQAAGKATGGLRRTRSTG